MATILRGKIRRASLAASCAAALTVTAHAQTTPESQARPGWTFTPSFTFGGTWDDNVLLVGEETVDPLPNDYVTGMTPAGTLDYRGPRLSLASGYQGRFVVYRELSGLNSLNQSARLRLSYRSTPYVTVTAAQTFATARETDSLELEILGVPFRRLGSRHSVTSGGLEARLSRRTTLSAGYDFRVVDFDDEELDTTVPFPGGHEHHVSGGLGYQLSPRASVGASYAVRRVTITDDPETVAIQDAAGVAEYRLSELVSVSGTVGISHLGAVGGLPPRTGLAWRGAVNARQEHFTVTASYHRSILPSFGFGGTFQNEELAGTVQGAFARNRAYWQAGAAWRDNDPLADDGSPSRRSIFLSSRLGYRVSPWLSVEGYYTRARQDTQRVGGLIHRNRLGFQIVTSRPLRLAQ